MISGADHNESNPTRPNTVPSLRAVSSPSELIPKKCPTTLEIKMHCSEEQHGKVEWIAEIHRVWRHWRDKAKPFQSISPEKYSLWRKLQSQKEKYNTWPLLYTVTLKIIPTPSIFAWSRFPLSCDTKLSTLDKAKGTFGLGMVEEEEVLDVGPMSTPDSTVVRRRSDEHQAEAQGTYWDYTRRR